MDPLASPIHIPVIPSRSIRSVVYSGHLLFLFFLFAGLPLTPNLVVAMFGVVASALIQRISYRRLAQMCSAILLRSDGQWNIIGRDGEIFLADLVGRSFVSPWLVVLRLKPSGLRLAHIVLVADYTDSQSFRRLRVRLRVPM